MPDLEKGVLSGQLFRVGTGQQRGHTVSLGSKFFGFRAPLAMLVAAASFGTGVGLGRQHAAVLAEPADTLKRATLASFHRFDPLPIPDELLIVFGNGIRSQNSRLRLQ